MTPAHFILSRGAPLLIGLWASFGFATLSYLSFRWTRSHEPRSALWIPQAHTTHLRFSSPVLFDHQPAAGLVSVIIPTHNRAQLIGRAIESALAQTYPRLEVVVADDGSSDGTRAIVESFRSRVKYVRQENAGVSAARNLGMRHARGEFVAFLDSDDTWVCWKIEAQVEALNRHPEAGLVWTDMSSIDEADRVVDARYLRKMYSAYEEIDIVATLKQVDTLLDLNSNAPRELSSTAVREGDLSSAILLGNLIHTSTVLFRRTWCQRTGGFDESYERAGEDYEFYIRLSSVGPVVFIDAPSTHYRIGGADQLTAAPGMILEIARNNLRAIQTWAPAAGRDAALPSRVIRRRFSQSFAWVGEAELEAGHRMMAARRLSNSLAVSPGLDKRIFLLASCALPSRICDSLHAVRRTIAANAGSLPSRHTSA